MRKITAISLGAGVQSSAMALMAAAGELSPMPDVAIFADTQSEPKAVYEYLSYIEKRAPFPIVRATAGSLWDDTLNAVRGTTERWSAIPFRVRGDNGKPSILRRQCTRDYKIRPIRRALGEFLGLSKGAKRKGRVHVTLWIGISSDEVARAKPSPEEWITHHFPLLDRGMNRYACEQWLAKAGHPPAPKSACVFCPFRSDESWREMRLASPADWERAVTFDSQIRTGRIRGVQQEVYLHRSLRPLDEAPLAAEHPTFDFDNECEGLCGN